MRTQSVIDTILFFVVISFITLLRPFYCWKAILIILTIAYLIGIICLLLILIHQKTLKREMIIVSMFFILLIAWQLLPFRLYIDIGYGGKFIVLFLMPFFLFLKNQYKLTFLKQTQSIFAVLGLLSFIIVFLLAIGIELPYYVINYNRGNQNEFFFLYPGTIILVGKMSAFVLPSGGILVRSSGIFAEPGHFGVMCGLLLAANGFSFRTTRNKMILLGGISTFSGGFYSILMVGLLIKPISGTHILSKASLRICTGIFLFALISIILFVNSPIDFQNRFLWHRIDQIENIEDLNKSRAAEDFNEFFDKYKTSAQSLIGVGALDEIDIRASDWRSSVASYGWLVIVFFFLSYFSLFSLSQTNKSIKMPLLFALAIIAFHRVSYMDELLVIAVVASALTIDTQIKGYQLDSRVNRKIELTPLSMAFVK